MFERFAKRWLGARKRGRGKGRGTKSRKARSGRAKAGLAKVGPGFLAALAKRPALLLACGAGIGLIVGALVATHRGSPPAVSAKPAASSEIAAIGAPSPEPPKVAAAPVQPAPALPPSATTPMAQPPGGGHQPWQQYAKAVPATEGRPMIAIVIDDMGVDKAESARVIDLPAGDHHRLHDLCEGSVAPGRRGAVSRP